MTWREIDPQEHFSEYMGATGQASAERITVYLPSQDRNGNPFPNREDWLNNLIDILSKMGGGATAIPGRGAWLNPESKEILKEDTDAVYSNIKPDDFLEHLPELRVFLHRLGRETDQGEVAFDYDGQLYRITDYDEE